MALIVVLVNVSDLATVSNYRYQVLVGDGTRERSTVIETGRVEGHTRSDGWEILVDKLLKRRIPNRGESE